MIPNTRTKYAPSPIFGNLGGFTVGDIPTSYVTPSQLVASTSVNASSVPFIHGGNSVELLPAFSDSVTSCTISVQVSDGTVVKTFNNVTKLTEGGLSVGGFRDSFLLAGDPIVVNVSNITGPGQVTVYARKIS